MENSSAIRVYSEITPNPASLKFIVNKLLINGSADFPTRESAVHSAFATALYSFPFVQGVFFASNFVTITKSDEVEWEEVQPALRTFVADAAEKGLPIQHGVTSKGFTGSEVEQKIQQILHDYVQPAVEQDGGAIEYVSFEEGVVTVALRGSCSGCPSATITLKSGIEALLKRMVPEVEEVVSEAM